MDGDLLPLERSYEAMTSSARQRRITIMQRRTSDPEALQQARNLGKDVFAEMGPDGEDALVTFLKGKLHTWQTNLNSYKTLADTGDYPGREDIADSLTLIRALLASRESYAFIERFNERRDDLLDLADTYRDLEHFYAHQKPTWDKLRKTYNTYALNRLQLEQDDQAAPALRRMQEILTAAGPYGLIKEAEGLIAAVDAVNTALLDQHRQAATGTIDGLLATLAQDIDTVGGDTTLRTACLAPLETLRAQLTNQTSIAHITQAEQAAQARFDAAQARLQAFVEQTAGQAADGEDAETPSKPVVKKIRPITPATLIDAPYLETLDDVHGFLDRLRAAMEDAIHNGERIQIR
jgi:hypothetical protein